MNNNQYSNERAEARKKARELGQQTTQKNWDNYSLGGASMENRQIPLGNAAQQQQLNFGDINKLVNDAVSTAKASIVAEVVSSVISTLRSEQNNENRNNEKIKKTTNDFEPTKAPMFNYRILPTTGGPASSIAAEINFKPESLYVLGLKGENLLWVETEECE